ncbi:hypothetical protein V3C99_018037, partial [Haemonchus contortus]
DDCIRGLTMPYRMFGSVVSSCPGRYKKRRKKRRRRGGINKLLL